MVHYNVSEPDFIDWNHINWYHSNCKECEKIINL